MGGGASKPSNPPRPRGGAGGSGDASAAAPASPVRRQLDDSLKGTAKTLDRIDELRCRSEFDETGAEIGFPPAELYLAAGRGDLAALEQLLKKATADEVAEKHWKTAATALHMAALQGHEECVLILLAHDADRTAVDTNGLTPLHYASLCPSVECIAALLSGDTPEYETQHGHRLPLSHHVTYGDETPLLLATGVAALGFVDFDVVKALIDDGCPLDAADCCGVTPLHLAATADEEEIVAALIKAGASIIADADGVTPLQLGITTRIASILRSEPVSDLEDAWTREADESLGAEGLPAEETAKVDDWSLASAKNVFVQADSQPIFIAKALFSYTPVQEEDLQFDKDDEIAVLAENIPGWEGWGVGRLAEEDKTGFFPLNYTQRISDRVVKPPSERRMRLYTLDEAGEGAGNEDDLEDHMYELKAQIATSEIEQKHLSDELTATREKLSSATAELSHERQIIGELRAQLKSANSGARTVALKSEEVRSAESSDEAKEVAASDANEGASTEQGEIVALKAELASLRTRCDNSEKTVVDEVARAERERSQWAAMETDLQKRLTDSNDLAKSLLRQLHQAKQHATVLRIENKVAAVAQKTAADAANAAAAADVSLVRDFEELKVKYAALQQQLVGSSLLAAAHTARVGHIEQLYREESAKRRRIYNQLQDAQGNIRVYARCRPLLPFEKDRGDSAVVSVVGKEMVRVPGPTYGRQGDDYGQHQRQKAQVCYHFNSCFGPSATQGDVFDECKDLVQSAFDGFNVCMFAYGQTGSGKTHTMYGDAMAPGMAPRTIEAIWRQVEAQKQRGSHCQVQVYMLELYLDALVDLLLEKTKGSSKGPKLAVKKDANGFVYVQNVSLITVSDAQETMKLLDSGQTRRHVSGTAMNAQSSRSHLVFSVVLTSTGPTGEIRKGKISLVDMAGSERVQRSEVTGEAFKEAVAINKSLSALLDVIDALSKKGKTGQSQVGVPYRSHLLTQLMSDSLGGNAKTLMFVNISPADSNVDETRNALGYATRASTITNKIEKGGSTSSGAAAAALAENEELRAAVSALRAELQKTGAGARAGTLVRTATKNASDAHSLY